MPVRHLPSLPSEPDLAPPPADEQADGETGPFYMVGDLAKAAGKTVRAIHLYEELGLLTPLARSKGRYRLFDRGSLVRVRWIGKLQDLGLSLGEIQGVIRDWEQAPSAPSAMKLMRETYAEKLADTRAQIARLRALESELAQSLAYLETCDTCDPARLLHACTSCDLHDCQKATPELVAGFRTPLLKMGAGPKG